MRGWRAALKYNNVFNSTLQDMRLKTFSTPRDVRKQPSELKREKHREQGA
jgi:hypothetical protein